MNDIEIEGQMPDVIGKACDAILVQEFWLNDALNDEVNILFLCVDGTWSSLYFDCGILFCRNNVKAEHVRTRSLNSPDGFDYPVRDVGADLLGNGTSIVGLDLDSYQGINTLTLRFSNDARLTLIAENDRTRIKTTQPTSAGDSRPLAPEK